MRGMVRLTPMAKSPKASTTSNQILLLSFALELFNSNTMDKNETPTESGNQALKVFTEKMETFKCNSCGRETPINKLVKRVDSSRRSCFCGKSSLLSNDEDDSQSHGNKSMNTPT